VCKEFEYGIAVVSLGDCLKGSWDVDLSELSIFTVGIESKRNIASSGVFLYEFIDTLRLLSVAIDSDSEGVGDDDSVILVSPGVLSCDVNLLGESIEGRLSLLDEVFLSDSDIELLIFVAGSVNLSPDPEA
jgi:hypothetical protein